MLRELRLQNIALIEEADLHFSPGLTVLTGETGAGKSLLIGALRLVLGERVSGDSIRQGAEEAIVEALFDGPRQGIPTRQGTRRDEEGNGDAQAFLEQDEILIRRTVAKSGKSRVTINGQLATLTILESLADHLVEMHGQHQHQSLRHRSQQLDLLDGFGRLHIMRAKFETGYRLLTDKKVLLEAAEALSKERSLRDEFLRFQEREISEAAIQEDEEERLLAERRILTHGEKLAVLCQALYQGLYEAEGAVLTRLRQSESWLREISGIDERSAKEWTSSVGTALFQLQEVAQGVRLYQDRLEFNPQRLAWVEERLHLMERLKKKYGGTVADVVKTLEHVREELDKLGSASGNIKGLRTELEALQKEVLTQAQDLSKKRTEAAGRLERLVEDEMSHLGMAQSQFRVVITSGETGPMGMDQIDFLMTTNPGEDPRPLARIASGGELSRMMLAFKTVMATAGGVPTLIFDEVDTGIGGKVAEEVGIRLKRLSQAHQVACITHLPQIASLADHHYGVEKSVVDNRTQVRVRRLNPEERVEEIARMLGGKSITETTRRHAREMLGRT